MKVVILKQAKKELLSAPRDILVDVFALLSNLEQGKQLSLPISRPLFSIAKGLHELRLSGKNGEYRVYYVIKIGDSIYVLHAAQKKKQELDKRTFDLLRSRLKGLYNEN